MNLIKSALLIILLLFSTPSFAGKDSKKITVGVYEIPSMITSTDSGAFIDLFKEAAKRAGIDYKIEMYPSKRTIRYFQTGQVEGLIPAFDDSTKASDARTEPVYTKNNVVFVRKDSKLITRVDQLTGKTVGLTRGYHYDDRIFQNPDIKIKYGQSDMINIKKLSAGEIDAFVVEEKTGLGVLRDSMLTDIHYSPESTLYGKSVFFAFQGNKKGHSAAEKISKALLEMKKDGTFKSIMDSYLDPLPTK